MGLLELVENINKSIDIYYLFSAMDKKMLKKNNRFEHSKVRNVDI